MSTEVIILSKSQMKAMQAYIEERTRAINGLAEIMQEAGLDPNEPGYQIDWQSGVVTLPEPLTETPMELVPNRATRRARGQRGTLVPKET